MPDEDGSGVSTAQPDVRLLAEVFVFVPQNGRGDTADRFRRAGSVTFVYSRECLSV